jgi:hypothetical protein
MTNETFVPMGLVELTKQVADSARANIKSKRKQVDDLEDRLHSALDAKRDVASDYVEQLDSIADKEVEVKLDPITDLIQNSAKANDAVFMAGFDAGYEKGFWKGYNTPASQYRLVCKNTISVDGVLYTNDPDNISNESLARILGTSEQRDRELLESHGIDVDGFCDDMVKIIKDHEQDIDEDEPDQYPDNYGGTK